MITPPSKAPTAHPDLSSVFNLKSLSMYTYLKRLSLVTVMFWPFGSKGTC